MTRVAIIGVTGRMGRALVRAANESSDFQLVAGVASSKSSELGKDLRDLAGLGATASGATTASGAAASRASGAAAAGAATGVVVTSDLRAALANCDVAIDFSSAAATAANVAACEAARKPVVIGTTGLSSDALHAIEKASLTTAVLVAPNTSIGVTLLIELVRAAAKTLPADFDIEISEAHHRNKRDAPSGTALALGKAAAESRGQDLLKVSAVSRNGESPRKPGEIGFAVTRGGDIVGDHTVLFAGAGEQLMLGHRATDRAIFARGALKAAAWLTAQPAGRYWMRDVLGYKTET